MSHSIVVIEDEPTIAASLAARLRMEGFAVAVAHDGIYGIDLASRVRPDLVVLDLMLPGMDGWRSAVASSRFAQCPW